MASRGSHGFGEQPYKEKESEEGAEVEGRRDGDFQLGENSLVGNLDCWTLSSSQEILEDEELLRELKDYQHHLEEDEQGFDLGELQDLERVGDINATSPLPEEKGSSQGMRSYLQLDRKHEEDSTELEKTRGTWDFGSQEDVHPELSFEGQYGSDFSPSPEILQDPLAFYKCSSASDNVDDELSESSNLNPSPCGPPPMCTQLETEPQILGEDGLDFPEDRKFSWELGRNLDSHGHSSLESSLPYNQRLLDFQSLEDLQNCPGIDAETCPELSWMEDLEQPLEKEPPAEIAQTIQQLAFNNNTVERLSDSRETTQMSHTFKRVGSQLEKRTRKPKADVPHGLLSKGPRQSRSLSPQRMTGQKKSGHPALKEPDRETQSNSGTRDVTQYGRGKLNYPLPDLSKVEPRVKFPKDPQSYQPPQGKSSPASWKEVRKPVIFKSPAEIVREVLLSSGEGSPQKCPTPTISVIPEELKSPRQATELVHQLQEDYHKLLTKYAEAENTIDRLRLSAKVRLYSDPPKPSQAAEMGKISEASKVVTFSIPQIRSAEITKRSSQASISCQGEGFPRQQVQHSSLSNSTGITSSETDRPISKMPFLGDHLTRLLAAQASKFQTQMEFLEDLIQTDKLEAMDQLKGFARLKEAQEALEQAYLQARNKYQQLNQNGAMETLGEFDPNRAVEGNVFHLGLRLEGLKERIERPTWNQPVGAEISPQSVPSHPSFPVQLSEEQMGTPTPSLHAPVPSVCIPYPEASTPKKNITQVQLEGDLSSISDGADEEEDDFLELPQPCKPQEEEDMDYLLDKCSSFRSLPEALSHKHNAEELGSEVTAAAGTKGSSLQKASASNKIPSASKGLQEKEGPERSLRKVQQPTHPRRHVSSIQAEAALTEPAEINRPTVAVHKMFSRRQQAELSPHSSMASIRGSIASESAAPHSPRKMDTMLCEDLRIVSPETDSGFVGSETSRASPLAQMPKHQLAKMRSYSIQRPPSTIDVPPCSPSSKKAPGVAKQLGPEKSPGQVKPEAGRNRCTLAKRNSLQKSSPCRWTNEMEPEDNENFHPDSETETETHGGTSLDGSPPPRGRDFPSSPPISSNMAQARHKNFLHSRLERDEAIEALQHEVSRLRQSLEESLHRQSPSPHPSRVQDVAHLYPSVTPARTSRKSVVESDESFLAAETKGKTQKPSLAQHGSDLDFNPSESDDALSKLQNGKPHATSRIRPLKQRIVQGPYTGTQYPISIPESQDPKRLQTSPLGHQSVQLQHGEDSAGLLEDKETKGSPRDGSRPSKQRATEGWVCPSCKDSSNSRKKDIAGAGDHKENIPEESSRMQPKLNQHQQPKQAGLWYLAVPSAATSVNYIPAIPLAQYPVSSIIYSPPPVPTSISSSVALPAYDSSRQQATEWKTSRHRLREYHCCSRTFLPATSLEDLNWTLNRAVEAAKDMKFTTEQMNKSLSWALRKARNPRTSCLF
ncbi:microtubule organization protein AKNA isoform X1 [Pantherophis guttatus]|uniref:Microtubule organization protein AKNA isoform X1 n=1 Tax=Pantherophis guttatus TaxID=94885 RepID=A0A6P9CB09_PANGU|nr:microtubule organization protein AKNA isoform X1 [Pantherophis guttatus]XP_034280511.1 microtubule organization protein AKNA isoform X1 [Pantherophis guttatus]XP_034280512.1 microtubule organization protein AKNA isoform X1 [Pantherophis guttatus]